MDFEYCLLFKNSEYMRYILLLSFFLCVLNVQTTMSSQVDDYLTISCEAFDEDPTGQEASYIALCEKIPEQPLPYWRYLLQKFGVKLFVFYQRVRSSYMQFRQKVVAKYALLKMRMRRTPDA